MGWRLGAGCQKDAECFSRTPWPDPALTENPQSSVASSLHPPAHSTTESLPAFRSRLQAEPPHRQLRNLQYKELLQGALAGQGAESLQGPSLSTATDLTWQFPHHQHNGRTLQVTSPTWENPVLTVGLRGGGRRQTNQWGVRPPSLSCPLGCCAYMCAHAGLRRASCTAAASPSTGRPTSCPERSRAAPSPAADRAKGLAQL